ncbi:hypothetical protein L3Q82_020212, partial [Scortum barcoo]
MSTPGPLNCGAFGLDQVRTQLLKKIKARKAKGPDGISSRLLRDCADQLCQVVCYIFNLSLSLERVPVLWKTSCVVPVPKTSRPKEPNHFRPVALTSHLMKALERIVLRHLRPLVSPNMDPLQFAYQPSIGVDDAVIYLLQRSLSHLEDAGNTVRITFFDFSSAFNTIHPSLLRVKLERAGASDQLAAWVTNYLTDRPQFVRLQDCVSDDVVVCSFDRCPQGTVLSPFLFTLYTSDFTYSTDSCHLQKFSDDTAIVGCVSEGTTTVSTGRLIMDFVDWCELNHLQVNASKTKEMQSSPLHAEEAGIFWCVQATAEDLFMRLWWRLWSPMQWSAGEGAVLSGRDKKRLNRLIKRASSVCGCPLDSIEVMGERRALAPNCPPSWTTPSPPLCIRLCGGLKQLLQQQTQTPK